MINSIYYAVKPLLPRRVQILLRRQRARYILASNGDKWPIWNQAGATPPQWPGWPGGKRFVFVPTHDVELDFGVSQCEQLADLEEERGIRSAFAFVPLRYRTPDTLLRSLVNRGFGLMVHGLYHDGKLYRDRRTFDDRRGRINDYLKAWNTRGFASPAAHHNLEWISELDIKYDISTYDTDPFEPQSCALGRIFPFWVKAHHNEPSGFVELPYTLVQDFTLFILMGASSNAIWRRKLDWIAERGGMALIKTHPDYMAFRERDKKMDRYPVELYTDLLDYVRSRYGDDVWIAQPSEVADYWHSLRVEIPETSEPITLHEAMCPACRQGHAEDRFTHYPPHPIVG
jgi:hypothetical protein